MSKPAIPPHIMKVLKSVTAKRPRTVIEHIIKHGHITTEELKEQYGYNHPPRAAGDVREQGIPLVTFKVRDSTGRSIGAYRFGAWKDFRSDRLKGRNAFSKQFKKDLVFHYGEKCHICSGTFAERYLQIDHRIPYEVAGDERFGERNMEDYMLLCSSCNRAKSWSCEHCQNWREARNLNTCSECYWATPENYRHIAMRDIRRLDLVWQEKEVNEYEHMKQMADSAEEELPDFVKELLRRTIKQK